MWDWNTIRQIIDNLPGNNPLQNKSIVVANEIMDAFNLYAFRFLFQALLTSLLTSFRWYSHYNKENPEKSVSEGRKIAEKIFGKGWAAKGAKVYEEGDRKKVDVWGIGHCECLSCTT